MSDESITDEAITAPRYSVQVTAGGLPDTTASLFVRDEENTRKYITFSASYAPGAAVEVVVKGGNSEAAGLKKAAKDWATEAQAELQAEQA